MKNFILRRTEDVSGISGTGIVAEGTQFSDGVCVLNWTTPLKSVAIYKSIEELIAIHGHDKRTIVVWLDLKPVPRLSCLQCLTNEAVNKLVL